MTTTEPALSREIACCRDGQGMQAIDAPVSGEDVGAQNAALSIMGGGGFVKRSNPSALFQRLGKKVSIRAAQEPGNTRSCVIKSSLPERWWESAKACCTDSRRVLIDADARVDPGRRRCCWTLDNLAPRPAEELRPRIFR